MPALPDGLDQPAAPDGGQPSPGPAAPYTPAGWSTYAPYPPPASGQPSPHPGTVYPPPHPGTVYPPPAWADWQPPTPSPTPPPPSRGQARRRGGVVGTLMTAGLAVLKYGALFSKFGLTAVTMLVAIVAYSLIFGWAFAVGLVLLIFVHEMGHFLTSRALGVPMSAPVFIPFLGAFTAAGRGFTSSRRVEAVIAIAGPIAGFAATLALYLWALAQPFYGQGVAFAISLSYFGFFITLFNLVPMLPLDGGRVASAISRWFNLAGLVILGALLGSQLAGATVVNPILILIFLVGCYSVWGRFRSARMGTEAPQLPVRTRVVIGAAYVGLVALSALLMSLSLGWLTAHQFIQVS
ncbi:MAG: site-2 protease family protein [Candidatus Dormibacteria bacterium]